jgi:hypothetical protein
MLSQRKDPPPARTTAEKKVENERENISKRGRVAVVIRLDWTTPSLVKLQSTFLPA